MLRVLETTYVGAMLEAGLGHLDFGELPERLREAVELMTGAS